jgi:hypothetical protein
MTEKPFQEDMEAKRQWLLNTQVRLPPGTPVRVIDSDLDEYIGVTGSVVDYDIGRIGDWPLIGVRFDSPMDLPNGPMDRDGFYDAEIEPLTTGGLK